MHRKVEIPGAIRRKARILGKGAIPLWLIVLALVVAGAGAAVGTILAGKVTGEIPVTISQALEVGRPRIHDDSQKLEEGGSTYGVTIMPQSVDALDGDHSNSEVAADSIFDPDRWIGVVNDEQTAFQFAAEIDQHDYFIFCVPLKNASNQDMTVELKLVYPEGITVEVMDGHDGSDPNVNSVTRTGPYTWKFELESDADKTDPSSGDYEDSLVIVVAASDTIAPGFFTIESEIIQISY